MLLFNHLEDGFFKNVTHSTFYVKFSRSNLQNKENAQLVCAVIRNEIVSSFPYLLGRARVSHKRTGDDTAPLTHPPTSRALSSLQWLVVHAS